MFGLRSSVADELQQLLIRLSFSAIATKDYIELRAKEAGSEASVTVATI